MTLQGAGKLKAKIIAIDPGHGGTDPGAVGHGLKEKDLTLKLAQMVKAVIDRKYKGAECRFTRGDDKTVSLASRTGMANSWKSDCMVSIHINSAANIEARGFESFVYTTDGAASKSVALQNALHSPIAAIFLENGSKERGTKKANLHMVREFKGAAVLVEFGFIANVDDCALLKTTSFLKDISEALADGIAKYLQIEKVGC